MSFGYYAFKDQTPNVLNLCSRHSEEFPLMVNCTGNISLSFPFTTDNPSGREDYYLLYMLQGEMQARFPQGTVRLHRGDAVIFPPHYHYTYQYTGEAPLNYLYVHFTGSYAEELLSLCQFGELPCLHDTGNDPRIPLLFRELYDCFEMETPLSRAKSACILERILLQIGERIQERSLPRSLEKSLRLIHSSYQEDLRIPDLAHLENLSHSRYVTVFRERMGMSPTAYIISRRMNTACELLENTDIPVKQVGVLVGYDDPHFFSKIFKKHTGLSPRSYRDRQFEPKTKHRQ